MSNADKATRNGAEALYSAPRLTVYGQVSALTASGSGTREENRGADVKPDRIKP